MTPPPSSSLPPILPVGTAVVLRRPIVGQDRSQKHARGSVGSIIHAPSDPTHQYRIRFVGGDEAAVSRDDVAVLSHFKSDGMHEIEHPLAERDLWQYVVFRCVVGSRAYGLEREDSDVDRRGVYLPPADLHWSLYGVPEQLEEEATQECYWELEKFLTLAAKANPNVLECLYSPLVEHATPIGSRLVDLREAFLSKLVYQTYNGYVQSQFRKLAGDLRNKGAIQWKHAMHLIRLLISGVTILRERRVPVRVEEHRNELLAIRSGGVPWEQVDDWRLRLHKEFDEAFGSTLLPEWPDYPAINEFLIAARRSML
jgi:hypothetical protein